MQSASSHSHTGGTIKSWPAWAAFVALACAAVAVCAQVAATPVPLPPTPPRPGGDSAPIQVGYGVWIGDVTRIDSAAQAFDASIVVILRWRDPALAHPGPGAKQYALEDIWYPQLLIANETEEATRSLPQAADVAPDGTAVYRQRIVGTFSQALNLRSFPFDQDTFRIQFVVPGHRSHEVEFVPDETAVVLGMRDGVRLGDKLTVQDWRVSDAAASAAPFHVVPGLAFSGFNVEFVAARQAHHFVIKVIIPLILIVAMSWAVFWIEPTDAATQMGVAVTAMLTLIAYRFAIDSDVPKLPYLTRLDAFVLMSSLLVFFSLLEVVVTTKLANLGRMETARAIDRRCRWIFPVLFTLGTIATLAGWIGGPGPS